mmetsp:Transcript_102658/g.260773  ORF Transcript_102658/g.260773 Transcript_102658/m.260773 type:complete len:289 (-) Transcript_102658:227-1093(-)
MPSVADFLLHLLSSLASSAHGLLLPSPLLPCIREVRCHHWPNVFALVDALVCRHADNTPGGAGGRASCLRHKSGAAGERLQRHTRVVALHVPGLLRVPGQAALHEALLGAAREGGLAGNAAPALARGRGGRQGLVGPPWNRKRQGPAEAAQATWRGRAIREPGLQRLRRGSRRPPTLFRLQHVHQAIEEGIDEGAREGVHDQRGQHLVRQRPPPLPGEEGGGGDGRLRGGELHRRRAVRGRGRSSCEVLHLLLLLMRGLPASLGECRAQLGVRLPGPGPYIGLHLALH